MFSNVRKRRKLGLVAAAAAAAVTAGALFGAAAPAMAHDDLAESTPAAGERLEQAPDQVILSFTAEVLDEGLTIMVVDAAGDDWATGEVTADQGVVTAQLEPDMPDAGYEIVWRVVSSDGHPISGVIPFVVGDGEPLVRDSEAGAEPSAIAGDDGETSVGDQSTEAADSIVRLLIIAGIGAALALIVLFIVLALRKRTRAAGDHDTNSAA